MDELIHIKQMAIVGSGSWGTAIAIVIAETNPTITVKMWAYEKEVVSSINRQHTNPFLPGVKLPPNISATNSLEDTIKSTPVVLFATPSKVLPDIAGRAVRFMGKDTVVGYLTKGFCRIDNSIVTISRTLENVFPFLEGKVVAISGPSHAEEVSRHYHTCLNIGSKSEESRSLIISLLTSEYLQCRGTDDITGVEVGGTLKNPAAIAAGMISVLPGGGDNLAGALISEALKEMLLLGRFFGARDETIIDISGLGDLVATALSDHSRNRRFGQDIGRQIVEKGYALTLIDRLLLKIRPHLVVERMSKNLHYLAEGAYAIEPLIELAEENRIIIPVYRSLYEVLLNRKEPSLLIETIKNPRKFFDLYSESKMLLKEKKRGLEGLRGRTFTGPVTEKTIKYCKKNFPPEKIQKSLEEIRTSPWSRDRWTEKERSFPVGKEKWQAGLKEASAFYARAIADIHFSFVRDVILFAFHLLKGRKAEVRLSGKIDDVKELKESTSIIYISRRIPLKFMLQLLFAMRASDLALPRFVFYREDTGFFTEYLLKFAGGISLSRERMGNTVFRSAVFNYITTMLEHGLPVLYQCKTGKHIGELHDCISSSLKEHGGEISYFPLVVDTGKNDSGAVHYSVSDPLILSDFTRSGGELEKVHGLLADLLNY